MRLLINQSEKCTRSWITGKNSVKWWHATDIWCIFFFYRFKSFYSNGKRFFYFFFSRIRVNARADAKFVGVKMYVCVILFSNDFSPVAFVSGDTPWNKKKKTTVSLTPRPIRIIITGGRAGGRGCSSAQRRRRCWTMKIARADKV